MLKTSELDVISTAVDDDVGSDHLPVIVELDWPIALNSARKSYLLFFKSRLELFSAHLQPKNSFTGFSVLPRYNFGRC